MILVLPPERYAREAVVRNFEAMGATVVEGQWLPDGVGLTVPVGALPDLPDEDVVWCYGPYDFAALEGGETRMWERFWKLAMQIGVGIIMANVIQWAARLALSAIAKS